ncbi:hypothetical protein AU15_11190 [Marinobacter salarius]|uniref:Uncharacterized protein n=1 Tax=Marinobacter salarius TaxID=1420917 RepID=W5YVT4_9GAMM|nr:hypothetical protein AU15_11190 [Marinobacter salarius]
MGSIQSRFVKALGVGVLATLIWCLDVTFTLAGAYSLIDSYSLQMVANLFSAFQLLEVPVGFLIRARRRSNPAAD